METECVSASQLAYMLLRQKFSWIPASERLPLVGVRVLVLWDGDDAMVCERLGDGWWSYSEGQTRSTPSHWMPLPEPPTE